MDAMEQRPKYAITKDAPTEPNLEESAVGTGQRLNAAMKDALTKRGYVESVNGMDTIGKVVVMRDVLICLFEEESVVGMVRRVKSAVMMDAPIKSRREECAEGMGRRPKNANMKDVLAMPSAGDSVSDMAGSLEVKKCPICDHDGCANVTKRKLGYELGIVYC